MKGIIIRDCLSCPFSDIKDPDNGGFLVCEFGGKGKLLCRMVNEMEHTIPDWCKLDDLQEVVESAVLEYGMKCKG